MPLPFLSPWDVSTTRLSTLSTSGMLGLDSTTCVLLKENQTLHCSFSPSWSLHIGNSGGRGEQVCINLSLESYCDLLDTSVSTQITASWGPKIARIGMLEITPDIFKAELLRLGNPTVTPREEFSSRAFFTLLSSLFRNRCFLAEIGLFPVLWNNYLESREILQTRG